MLEKLSWRWRQRFSPDLIASLIIVGIGVLFFSDFLFSSKNFYFRDILNFHYPLRKVLIESYFRGELPLWNPFIYLGQPMLANPNYMAFYPSNLFHLFLPFNYAFKLHFIIHPILAGLGAYFLQRRLGIGCLAALTGSLAYEFSGTLLSFLNLYNIIPAVALLPWIGFAFVGALEDRWLKRSLILGALLGLQIIAFEPLMFQCLILIIVALAAYHLLEAKDRLKALGNMLRIGLISAAFGLGLAAIQVLPTLELLPLSARGYLDLGSASRWSMHPLDFLNTIVPNLFGSYYTIDWFSSWGWGIHEGREGYLVSFFLGSCSLLLASLSFASRRRRLWVMTSGLAFAGIFLALGKYNPACQWLFDHVPFFALGRYPSKYFLLSTLSICVMASLGVEVLLQQSETLKERRCGLICAACGICLAGMFLAGRLYVGMRPEILEQWLRYGMGAAESATKDFVSITANLSDSILSSGIYLLAGSLFILSARHLKRRSLFVGLLPVLIMAELIPANLRLSPSISDADVENVAEINAYIKQNSPLEQFRVVPPDLLNPIPEVRQLRASNRSVAWLTLFNRTCGQPFYGIMSGMQYSLYRSIDYLNTVEASVLKDFCSQMPDGSGLLLLARLNSPLVLSLEKLNDPRLQLISTFDTRSELQLRAYWLNNALGRAYFVSDVDFVDSQREALERFLHPDFPAGNRVILEGEGTLKIGQSGARSVKIINYRSSRVECEVYAETDGYLVLLDSYYPGWHAYVDGNKAEVLRANFAFRAVSIPPGEHRAEFIYKPVSFYLGFALSLIALLSGFSTIIFMK